MIRLQYIQRFTDRHGKVRHYFRKPGEKRVALPGTPGSPEFMAAYATALRGATPATARPPETRTWDALVDRYFESAKFKRLAPSSRVAYRRTITRMIRDEGIGHRPVAGMRREHVMKIVDRHAENPSAAYDYLKKIRMLLDYAVQLEWREYNPALKIETPELGEYHTWEEDEIEQFEARWPLGSRERTAFALLLYTGQRTVDVRGMTWRDLAGNRVRVTQQKTGRKLSIAIHPGLRAALDAHPRETQAGEIIRTDYGQPFSQKGFGQWLADKFDLAGLPDRCVAHGLRKAAARRLAEAGCSAKEIMAVTGHRSLREVQRYVDAADEARLSDAAVGKLLAFPPRRSAA